MPAQREYDELVEYLATTHEGVAGHMFGKKCIKINGKAAVALFDGCLVFKLPETTHRHAMSLSASILWDPSGKGRPMKEWVQVALKHRDQYLELAESSARYVS